MGEHEKPRAVTQPDPIVNPLEVEDNVYMAELHALNDNVAGAVSGNANFKIENNDFIAYIRFFNSISGLVHEQRYYQADACPTLEQDTNADGYIDIQEANAFLGQPLFPLDFDISSEEAQYDVFPGGDAVGGYWYEQIVPMETLMMDLKSEDLTPENDFRKMAQTEELNLNRGIVLIMGISPTIILPETVASSGGYGNFQTLPVACGSLKKIYVVPGTIQGDEASPLPNGEEGGALGEYDNAPILHHTDRKGDDYGSSDYQ